ncbi:MAG: phage replisome organizer N-terminal domain-containing protein, partial [Syntrophothermus sp.]
MAEKTYYFLKLPSGFFKDRPLKKLRRMAGGAVYTIIYQKLLLLSLENEGKLFFEEIEETFEEEMALELDETIEDIQMTLIYLQKNNLIQQVNQYEYFLPQIPEMISKETDAARRKRKSRENKLIVTESQKSVTSSQDVTKCHTELEVRSKKLDLEKELELDLEKEKETPPAPPDDKPKPTPYKKIEDLYHKLCPTFNKIQKMTNARKD